MVKEIKLQIPDGKCAEWINGILTLVDEPKIDKRPVTERIKTFEDAVEALGNHPFVNQYRRITEEQNPPMNETGNDIIAYLKLRIICAALNEGWEPKFKKGEDRYFPWLRIYTQDEYEKMADEQKSRCVLRSGSYTYASCGFVSVSASHDASSSGAVIGARLAFKTNELARYAGRQFTEEWADFMFKPRTSEELNGK